MPTNDLKIYIILQVKRIQSVPLVIGQFLEAVDHDHAIVGSTTGHFSCFFFSKIEYFLFLEKWDSFVEKPSLLKCK